MARAKAEAQQTTTGMTLIVMVGLAIVFLLFMAFLNVVKSGNVLNETNLLFAALIFYAGAGALYLGFGVTGVESYVKFASLATSLGLVANTAAIAHRWYEAGHPPFSSVYEMLLSFVWTLAVLTLVVEKKYGVKVIGTVTMPVAIVGVVLMQLLRTEVHPLVPALQSTWLHVHVTLAMLAYAACALSFALATMFLIQDKMKTETFLAITSSSTRRHLREHRSHSLREVGRPQPGGVESGIEVRSISIQGRTVVCRCSRSWLAHDAGASGGRVSVSLLRAGALEEERWFPYARQPRCIPQHPSPGDGTGHVSAACP